MASSGFPTQNFRVYHDEKLDTLKVTQYQTKYELIQQITSNVTAVTAASPAGKITLFGTLGATTTSSFVVNCPYVTNDSLIQVTAEATLTTGGPPLTPALCNCSLSNVGGGKFTINVSNPNGNIVAAPIIHYLILNPNIIYA